MLRFYYSTSLHLHNLHNLSRLFLFKTPSTDDYTSHCSIMYCVVVCMYIWFALPVRYFAMFASKKHELFVHDIIQKKQYNVICVYFAHPPFRVCSWVSVPLGGLWQYRDKTTYVKLMCYIHTWTKAWLVNLESSTSQIWFCAPTAIQTCSLQLTVASLSKRMCLSVLDVSVLCFALIVTDKINYSPWVWWTKHFTTDADDVV